MTLAPGIYSRIAADDYHSGQIRIGDAVLETPTLSASIARLLVSKSPAHARAAHPVLNPDLERIEEPKFDIGTAAHRLFLEGDDAIFTVLASDWRTKDAKAARDEARAAGKIPLLLEQAGDVRSMVAAAQAQLVRHRAEPPLFTDGKPEQTLIWQDDHGVLCRARLDWLRDDYRAVDDLKSTSASADPQKWLRTAYGMGADVQVAMYVRGVERLTGIRPLFRYCVIETYPPFAMSVVDLAPSAMALAEEKVQRAIDLWAECLANDSWPAYTDRVASLEAPVWEEEQFLQKHEAAA